MDPEVPMDEDCLYLNLWTSAKTGKEKMPVMIWIFGGGLMEGYPCEMQFDGERITRRCVILVSINYRLNVFGFLTHPEMIKKSTDGFVVDSQHLKARIINIPGALCESPRENPVIALSCFYSIILEDIVPAHKLYQAGIWLSWYLSTFLLTFRFSY